MSISSLTRSTFITPLLAQQIKTPKFLYPEFSIFSLHNDFTATIHPAYDGTTLRSHHYYKLPKIRFIDKNRHFIVKISVCFLFFFFCCQILAFRASNDYNKIMIAHFDFESFKLLLKSLKPLIIANISFFDETFNGTYACTSPIDPFAPC